MIDDGRTFIYEDLTTVIKPIGTYGQTSVQTINVPASTCQNSSFKKISENSPNT